MYEVSGYSNNNQELEDPVLQEESAAIETDTVDSAQDNDYNMSADEDISEKQTDTIIERERILDIEDELLSNEEEEMDTELNEMETRKPEDSYRGSLVEFNSEDEIENLEEDERVDKETNDMVEEKKSGHSSSQSLVELDELNNYQEDDDVQEIPPPSNTSMYTNAGSRYRDQEEPTQMQDDNLINENGTYLDKQAENEENEENKEIGVVTNSNQETSEDLNSEIQDTTELYENDYKEEINEVKDEEPKEEEMKEVRDGETRKVEANEMPNVIQKEYNTKIVTQSINDTEALTNAGSESRTEGIAEYKNELDKTHQTTESCSDNETTGSKIPDSKLACTFPIIINIAETDFLLVPFDKHKNPEIDVSHLVSLYDENDILKLTIEEFFGLMRTNEDLNEIHQFTVNKELVLVIPELNNLLITEDNIYSRDITIEDFIVTFENLKSNSINAGENLTENSITFLLTSQTRFITNFNNLSERIRDGKGFDCINLKLSVLDQSANESESSTESFTENLHKRQSISSNEETETQQSKRIKISI